MNIFNSKQPAFNDSNLTKESLIPLPTEENVRFQSDSLSDLNSNTLKFEKLTVLPPSPILELQKLNQNLKQISLGQTLIGNDVKEIKTHILNKKKKKLNQKSLPKRQPISQEFFKQMINAPKRKYEKHLAFSRFRVAITLLFFFGCRVNEIRTLTVKDFDLLYKNRVIEFYQSKVKTTRRVPIEKKAFYYFEKIQKDVELVFLKHTTLGGNSNSNSWTFFINSRLNFYKHQFNQTDYLKSHSFRVNFVNSLLKTKRVHVVAEIVGHKDIRNTMKYYRNCLSDSEIAHSIESLID